MKLNLYQLKKTDAFFLSKEALNQLGFTIHLSDERKGLITSSKLAIEKPDVLFLNILFSHHITYTTLHLISNTFMASNATFIAVKDCDERFRDRLHELITKERDVNSMMYLAENKMLANVSA